MNAELQVCCHGLGRASVVGVARDSPEADALEAWLGERIDVARFERRPRTGALRIEYDDGKALPGRFIRSLRDTTR
jgi:hypothetical protein